MLWSDSEAESDPDPVYPVRIQTDWICVLLHCLSAAVFDEKFYFICQNSRRRILYFCLRPKANSGQTCLGAEATASSGWPPASR